MTRTRPLARIALVATALAWSTLGFAQTIYRIVGPDGRVTFTDRPPADAKATPAPVVNAGPAAPSGAALPFELRGATTRYPVVIYTGVNCGPCNAARTFLGARGVPFTEKTVTTQEDIEALQRLSGAAALPFATIGGQQLKGFSEIEWGQFLDAAGYPRTSMLPSGFRNPQPTPLVQAQARPAPAPEEPRAPEAAPPPPAPEPENPAGFRF